ncbi:MAG: T9SS type A sorting domain-containing protein [Saprospiraceae bacterium]|nr:T9SS type A sorting domain-containing protein [Saprospiraceae bacterium]MBK9631519.1 T9SS type A sorting domain-containing protein [Saprospiraceae bacterium]
MARFRLLILIMFALQITSLYGQSHWTKISDGKKLIPDDLICDQNGLCYVGSAENPNIFEFDLTDPDQNFQELVFPFKPYISFYYPKSFMHDNDGRLMLRILDRYLFRLNANEKFDHVGLTDSIKRIYVTGYEKFNKQGELFQNYLTGILKFSKDWDRAGVEYQIFAVGQDEIIRSFFPFTDSINYAMVDKGINGASVFKYNSKDKSKREIISLTNIALRLDKSIVSENGHVFLPSIKGLLHYWEDGNQVEVCVLDSSIDYRRWITDLRWSLKGDFILAQLDKSYYFSYDTGRTWIRPYYFNQHFPSQFETNKLFALDSVTAVALMKDECLHNSNYILQAKGNEGWKELHLGQSFWDLNGIFKLKDGTIHASDENCRRVSSKDDGKSWQNFKHDSNQIKILGHAFDDRLFYWDGGDDNLFLSTDGGEHWDHSIETDGSILKLVTLNEDKVLLVSANIVNNSPTNLNYYLSTDKGSHFEKFNSIPYSYNNPISLDITHNQQNRLYTDANEKGLFYSDDLGVNWVELEKFRKWRIGSMVFDENNQCFISAYDGDKKEYGVYQTHDFVNLKRIFPTQLGIRYLGNGQLVAYGSTEGVLITRDYGVTWEDITKDLPLNDSLKVNVINDFYIDHEGFAYISYYYDGLYKSYEPIVSTKEIGDKDQVFSIYPNPTKDYLSLKLSDQINLPARIIIVNMLGQTVKTVQINNREEIIKLTELASGIYSVGLITNGSIISRSFFLGTQ